MFLLRFPAIMLATTLAASCTTPQADRLTSVPVEVNQAVVAALAKPNIAGIGIARIEDGEVIWEGYWGEQSPGVPVTQRTAFNTASVAKTLIAETTLRLADAGRMSLDDPIADYFSHDELSLDPRYGQLTPRVLLSHQAALLNWPSNYEDGRLAFIGDPGNGQVSYSGAGIEIVMRYLEARFDKSYPDLVQETVLDPLGVTEVTPRRDDWLAERVSEPRSSDGTAHSPFTRSDGGDLIEPGEYSAADNLYATVPGYTKLLIALIEGRGLSPKYRTERAALLSTSQTALGYTCIAAAADCPDPIGFGVGWGIFGEPGRTVLNHSGNDFAEHAQVYFIPETREGLVLFVNGGNAFPTGIDIIATIDPELRMAKHFRALIERMEAQGS